MIRVIIITVLLLSANTVLAEEEILKIDEKILINFAKENNPTIDNINKIYQQNLINELNFNNKYDYRVYGDITYQGTTDDWTQWDYSGTNKQTSFNVGMKKNWQRGMSTSIAFTDSDGNYFNAGNGEYDLNRSGIIINHSIDLWRNFLGYQSLVEKLNVENNKKQSLIKTEIEKNNFYQNIRKIYWNIISKKRELNFRKSMIVQSQKNLNNITKRYRMHIADSGDLARAKANLNLRKSQYNGVQIQIDNLTQVLQQQLPQLLDKKFIIESFDLTDTFADIMACNRTIYKMEDGDKNKSRYYDYMNFMDRLIDGGIKVLEREADFDLSLDMSATVRGTDENLSKSYDDLRNFDRNDYSVRLNFSKNLGDNSKELKMSKIKLLKMNYNYNKNGTLANIRALEKTYPNTMKIMFKNLRQLHSYKKNMETRLNNSRIKYNQGRLSLNDLIQDEDNLISANIQLIEMENSIIESILQYLNIFNGVNCKFNLNNN